MRLKFLLHKKSIFLYLCFLFTTYSCDGCMDDAEINNKEIDKREKYVVAPSVYKKTRKKIEANWNQIFKSPELDKLTNIKDFLPQTINNEDSKKTVSFARVNNNIVLEGFLQCCLQEKIWIELLIEQIEDPNKGSLQSKFEKDWENGAQAIGNILSNLNVEKNNLEIYSKIFELNKSLNDNVLKPIWDEIIKEGKKSENKNIDWENYENLPTYLTAAHMLLCEILPDDKKDKTREEKFKEKWNEYYTGPISQIKLE